MKNKIKSGYLAIILFTVLVLATMSACDSHEEQPDLSNQLSSRREYVIPPGVQMTEEERAIISARNKEYKEALGINN